MPSPLAHSLAGLTIAHALGPAELRGRAAWCGLALVAANAADLDFVAGAALGSINALHGGPSHSVAAALAFAAIAALVLRPIGGAGRRVFLVACAVYTSHVLLDMWCEASPTRPGLPLFWPLTDDGFLFPWRPLGGIAHGGAGAGVMGFLRSVFSADNVPALLLEVAVFLPPLAFTWSRLGVPRFLVWRAPARAVRPTDPPDRG